MYCPKCSQQQASEDVRFCSRCGFLLTGIAEVVKNDGVIARASWSDFKNLSTPRQKGFKQGLFALLLLILTSPILLVIAKEIKLHPAGIFLALFILFISCIIRMIYALMFQSNEPFASGQIDLQNAQNVFQNKTNAGSLPTPQTNPLADFTPAMQGKWRDSNELVFSSVMDATTKQLDKK